MYKHTNGRTKLSKKVFKNITVQLQVLIFFTLRLFRCLQENLGSMQPTFTYLGSLEKPWPIDGSYLDPGLGLWPAPDSRESPKMYISDFGALSIRNFVLIINHPNS
jgi:hypothetical protein